MAQNAPAFDTLHLLAADGFAANDAILADAAGAAAAVAASFIFAAGDAARAAFGIVADSSAATPAAIFASILLRIAASRRIANGRDRLAAHLATTGRG